MTSDQMRLSSASSRRRGGRAGPRWPAGGSSRGPGCAGRAGSRAPSRAGQRAATRASGTRSPAWAGRAARRAASRAAPRAGSTSSRSPRTFSSAGIERRELHQLVVEERRARLERVGHRRDVDLRDQVAGEVGRDVDLEHLVDDVGAGGRAPRPRRSRRGGAPSPAANAGRVERVAQRRVEQLHIAGVAGGRVERERAGEAPGAVAQRWRCRRPRAGAEPTAATARRSGAGERSSRPSERVGDVARVAAEGLVAAVAVERDGDVPAGQLGQVEARDRRRVGERLAVVADQLRRDARPPRRVHGNSSCSVPNCSAMRRACGSSSNSSWSKPIENVRTGSLDCSAIAATTALESTPPERNAPSGTSAIMRLRVASRSAGADPLAPAPRPAALELAASSRAASSADRRLRRPPSPACAPAGACARRCSAVSGAGT